MMKAKLWLGRYLIDHPVLSQRVLESHCTAAKSTLEIKRKTPGSQCSECLILLTGIWQKSEAMLRRSDPACGDARKYAMRSLSCVTTSTRF